MREYGKVSPQFWIGETGKKLRGNAAAQVLALYLMTCPHSTMTGVFHCPILYMAHETGLGMEGASKALQSLLEVGFCEYDEASESVFVVRMAAYQIDEYLKPKDNRVAGLRKEVARMPESRLKSRFLAIYGGPFCLFDGDESDSPSEAPSKPLRSQEQEQEQEQEKKTLMSGKPDDSPPDPDSPAGLLAYLNARVGSRFRPVKANLSLAQARLREATADEIRGVIDAKVREWRGTEMAVYLRPATLFGAQKFAQYLGEVGRPAPSDDRPWYVRAGYGDERSALAAGAKQPEAMA